MSLKPLEDFRQIALDDGPTCSAALEVHSAGADQPQAGHRQRLDRSNLQRLVHLQSLVQQSRIADTALGASVSIPLRIFDRNQGEKQRTLIDIDRNQQLSEAARAQVFSDVDSAYAQVESNIALLKPYKAKYKAQALRVRDTVTYSYEHGGASLMDFLNAQSDYRHRATGLPATDRLHSDRRRTTESCRGTRGDSMNVVVPSQAIPHALRCVCALAAVSRLAALRLQEKDAGRRRAARGPGRSGGRHESDHRRRKDAAKFPLVAAGQIESATELTATGTVLPDVSREIPVISLANGRVVDIKARLDDNVKKGPAAAQSAKPRHYRRLQRLSEGRATMNTLADKAFVRADDLLQHGAIAQAQLEAGRGRRKGRQSRPDRR